MTDTGTKKYTPTAGNADRLGANIPVQMDDIVIGAKQFANPTGIAPHWDTDRTVTPTRLPKGTSFHNESAKPTYDISNPVSTDVIPPLVRDF